MNISKQLQFFFKIFFQYIFFLIYGRVIYKKNKETAKISKIIKIDSKKYYVAKVKNGRIYTDYLENVSVIDNKNVLVNNVSYQQIDGAMFPAKSNSALVKGTPRLKKKIKGSVLCMVQGISAEIIDPIWLSPLDIDTIATSVEKTGRLLVVDTAWLNCGASAEIAMQVIEKLQGYKKIRVERAGFAETPCPTTKSLENLFYPNSSTIAAQAFNMIFPDAESWIPEGEEAEEITKFKGPF